MKDERFQEGQTKTIDLPDDTPEVFEAFVYHLYNNDFVFYNIKSEGIRQRIDSVLLCARIWVFADKMLRRVMQDAAMKRLCCLFNDDYQIGIDILTTTELAACFRIGADHKPLRLLVADYLVLRLHEGNLAGEIEQEFAGCAGIVEAIHASEEALHKLPAHHFPRCKQPRRFRDLLYVSSDFNCWSNEVHLDGSMEDLICEDCGYNDPCTAAVCRHCGQKTCVCQRKDYAVVCEDCVIATEIMETV